MSSPTPLSFPPPLIPSPVNTTSPPPFAVTLPPTAAASPQSTPLPPATSPPPPPLSPVASPSISPPLPVTNPPTLSPPATSPPQPPIPPPNSRSGKLPPATKSPPRSSPPPQSPPTSRVSLSPPAVQSSGGSSRGQVVGVAIGGVLVISVLCILFFFCCRKKKKKGQHEYADYYIQHSSTPPKDVQPWEWQHNGIPLPKDQVIEIVPKWPPPGGTSWRRQQSPLDSPSTEPPPPLISTGSSGGSMSNYSGCSNPNPHPSPSNGMALSLSKRSFSYEELGKATNGFSDANLLGQGGFGYVHKGVLSNAKEVAVKQLKAGSGQGEREFQAEVEIISRVHHKHLVSLVGYCIVRAERLLVYEFVPNNTLEFHLHGKGRPTMECPKRLRIALGAAKGLAYLHEDCHPKIIHRDIKAANILLDFNFEAKVADFGLAKITSDMNTHVSTRVMGTFGYLAPEYASSGKLTDKSDVFSFGVMLLELVTGRRPIDTAQTFVDDGLVEWARPLLTRAMEEGDFEGLVDPRLLKDYNQGEMLRMVASAAACVRHSARHRPRMSQVVRALEGDMCLSDLNEGNKPGHSRMNSSHESSDYDTMQYNEDMKKFRKMAFSSQEYASSEVSQTTSEYGLNMSESSSEGQRTREMDTGKMTKNRRGFSGDSNY